MIEDHFKTDVLADASQQQEQPSQSASTSNLLEINRYLRTEKEKIEEKYESLSLNHEISQQRLKNIEGEIEFYRQKTQLCESEITQLKQQLDKYSGSRGNITDSSIELMTDTNKRLKDDLEASLADNTKLGIEIRKLEDEILNLKSSLNMSELKNESLTGSTECLKVIIYFRYTSNSLVLLIF